MHKMQCYLSCNANDKVKRLQEATEAHKDYNDWP